MAVKLGRFELPTRVIKDEKTATETYARFVAEPFEAGFGHTIGNSLRRVLLSSLEGAAITAVAVYYACAVWPLDLGSGWGAALAAFVVVTAVLDSLVTALRLQI